MRSLMDRIRTIEAGHDAEKRRLKDEEVRLKPYSRDLYNRLRASVDRTPAWGKFDFHEGPHNPGTRSVSAVHRTPSRSGVGGAQFAWRDGQVMMRQRDYGEFQPYSDEARDRVVDDFLEAAAHILAKKT